MEKMEEEEEEENGVLGKSFVEEARKLMMEGTGSSGMVHHGTDISGEMQRNGTVSMPMYPPPPVPQERPVNGLEKGVESLSIHETIRYRDPLPEE